MATTSTPPKPTTTAPPAPASPASATTGAGSPAPSRPLRGDDALDAVERALIQVARVMIRTGVPEVLVEGEHVDRSGYWTLVRLDEAEGALRLSDLAAGMELDLSTVSRQARRLVELGLVTRQADPDDGRAARLALSERGRALLDTVRRTRRDVLRQTLARWGAAERSQLASSIARLASDMQGGCAR